MDLVISSPENSTFKALKKTAVATVLKKKGKTIVAGEKSVSDAVRQCPEQCLRLVISAGFDKASELVHSFAQRKALVVLKKTLFNELDIFGTGFALLEFAVPQIPPWDGNISGCTLAVPFQDPINVGSVIRSAVAFGVSSIILLREAAHPFHPKSIRASAGAVFTARFFKGPALPELVPSLSQPAPPVVGLDMRGQPLQDFIFPASFLLVPGSEGQGLPHNLHCKRIAIPMTPRVESLNAATATAIALFYWSMSLKKK